MTSAPASLRVLSPAGVGAIRASYLHRSFTTGTLTVTAQIRVDAIDAPDGDLDVLSLVFDGRPEGEYAANIVIDGSDVVLETNEKVGRKTRPLGARSSGFVRVSLAVDATGQVAGTYGDRSDSIGIAPPRRAELRVGVTWSQHAKGAWDVGADDLTVDHD